MAGKKRKDYFRQRSRSTIARDRGTSESLWGGKEIKHVLPCRLGKAEGLGSKAGRKINLLGRAGQGNAFDAGSKRPPGKI